MQTKLCKKCNQDKPLNEFHIAKGKMFGVNDKCKLCVKKYQKEFYLRNKERRSTYFKESFEKDSDKFLERASSYYENNKEKRAEAIKRYSHTPKGKLVVRLAQKNYRLRYPLKTEAREIFNYQVRIGKITKEPCAVCGDIKVDGHHYKGYDLPLEVQWLCRTHHSEVHKEQRAILKKID
jgi:hypothetical protein